RGEGYCGCHVSSRTAWRGLAGSRPTPPSPLSASQEVLSQNVHAGSSELHVQLGHLSGTIGAWARVTCRRGPIGAGVARDVRAAYRESERIERMRGDA